MIWRSICWRQSSRISFSMLILKFEANVGVVMLQQRHDMHGVATLVGVPFASLLKIAHIFRSGNLPHLL